MRLDKVVRLGTVEVWENRHASVFCKIEFENGKLSISGVEGPQRNGDALGSCGQIDMHLRDTQDSIKLAPGWTRESLARFFDVWRDWHLNDMKAGTPAQEAALKTADKSGLTPGVNHYDWSLRTLAALPPFTVWCYDDITLEQDAAIWAAALTGKYGPRIPKILATSRTFETRDEAQAYLSTLAVARNPEVRGLECDNGYKYGSQWLRQEVPADVIAFLESLPDTDLTPAWV